MEKNRFCILAIIVSLVASVIACQLTGTQPGREGTPASQSSVSITGDTPTPGSQLSVPILGGDDAGEPVVEAANVEAEPVRVVEELRDFKGEGNSYYYGKLLVVENPNPDLGIQDTRCELTAYSAEGAVVETDNCGIDLLLPGERRTIYISLWIQDKPAASKLEFRITQQGQPIKTSLSSASLSSERIMYWPSDGMVTGIVRNNTDYLVTRPLLTAVFYDEQGGAIGVATGTSPEFISPHGHAGASLSAPQDLKPARVELSVVPSGVWMIKPVMGDYLAVQITQPLSISIVGPGGSTGGGQAFFFVTNPNADASIGSLLSQVTAYDAQGFVLGVTSGSDSLPVIFPGEKVAVIGEEFSISHGSSIASIEVQVSSLVDENDLFDYRALGIDKNPLSAVDGQYQVENGPQVTCVLKNAWKNPIDSVIVTAVAYDSAGTIVGFGDQTISNVAAGGQTEVTIPMLMKIGYSGTPARIELFASADSLSSIH